MMRVDVLGDRDPNLIMRVLTTLVLQVEQRVPEFIMIEACQGFC